MPSSYFYYDLVDLTVDIDLMCGLEGTDQDSIMSDPYKALGKDPDSRDKLGSMPEMVIDLRSLLMLTMRHLLFRLKNYKVHSYILKKIYP